jgi:8-oxo-dGTP pyrophosphatase MutT (NUDIX family)
VSPSQGFQIAVGAICCSTPGTLLLVHRDDGDYDHWELPGGKVERGESALDAAVREIREELGMTCTTMGSMLTVRFSDRGTDNTCFIVRLGASGDRPRIMEPGIFADVRCVSIERMADRSLVLSPMLEAALAQIGHKELARWLDDESGR